MSFTQELSDSLPELCVPGDEQHSHASPYNQSPADTRMDAELNEFF
jgi:hypothetical protein